METILLVIHLLIAAALVGVVLMQKSEGGGLGIGGGGGGGGAGGFLTGRGTANLLTRTTAGLALAFFITSIALTMLARGKGGETTLIDEAAKQEQSAPAKSGDGKAGAGGGLLDDLEAGRARSPLPVVPNSQ